MVSSRRVDVLRARRRAAEPCGRHLEQLTGLEQLLQRHVLGVREQAEARAQRLGDVVRARDGDEAPPPAPFAVRIRFSAPSSAQRLPDRRAVTPS